MTTLLRFSFAFVLGALTGCAASPELADYPRREIDRPFVLPKGTASWSTVGEFQRESGRYSDGSNYVDHSSMPIFPLIWQQSLGERWNLIWAPIPLGVLYQIRSDESVRSGLSFALSFGLSNNSDYNYANPEIGYTHLRKLSGNFGVGFSPGSASLHSFRSRS